VLAATHFLLDSAPLDQLTKTADGFLKAFTFPNNELYHAFLKDDLLPKFTVNLRKG